LLNSATQIKSPLPLIIGNLISLMQPFALPLQRQCEVLAYHPSGIWAINKRNGVLSHPNKKEGYKNSVLQCPYDFENERFHWLDEQGQQQTLYLVHRLDSATSGVLVAASSKELAGVLKIAFANREIHKIYHAIVEYNGKPVPEIWKDSLVKKSSQGKIRVVKNRAGLPAITKAKIDRKKRGANYSIALLCLTPTTGRTHQLRVQAALRKLPIIGDRTYGNFSLNRKIARLCKEDRLFLHASQININIKTCNGEKIKWEVESPLPRSFGRLLS